MMKKILIITQSQDYTVKYFSEKFKDQSIIYRLDLDNLNEYDLKITNEDTLIENSKFSIKMSEIDSIYYRKPRLPSLEDYDSIYHNLMKKDIIAFITGIADSFQGKCLSKPSILKKAENKVYQLYMAKEIGLKVPNSLITNSSKGVQDFILKQNSIIKPLSLGKFFEGDKVHIIHTNTVDSSIKVDNLELSPSYFQEYIEKEYEIRLTVVNNHFFPVKIITKGKVDWRTDEAQGVEFENTTIPHDIEVKCLKLLKNLDLNFGAFDFLVKDGEYIFLEVNPNGQWLWLEKELNLNIAQAIFDFLTGEKYE